MQISVIIPTHNRRDQLRQGLEALAHQTLPAGQFEVIVVADGCSDETVSLQDDFAGRLQLRILEQPALGPAAARNRGARQARSPYLIFMDDDITPAPGFVAGHLEALLPAPERVVIGYLPPSLGSQTGYFRLELFDWWEANFARLRRTGYRFRYSDLTSGNFSLSAAMFWKTGGFAEDFRCHEDYELGVRLMRQGADFIFSDTARGEHHEHTPLPRSLQRKFEEGSADVRLGRLYPELRPTFLMWRLERYSLLPSRVLKRLAFGASFLERPLTGALKLALALCDRLGLYRTWQRVLYGLLGYWYWRGAAHELGSLPALNAFLPDRAGIQAAAGEEYAWLELDLAAGLETAEAQLDLHRPDAIRLTYDGLPVGIFPPEPGGEKLAKRHLRPRLVRGLAAPLLRSLAVAPDIVYPEVRDRLIAMTENEMRLHPPEAYHD